MDTARNETDPFRTLYDANHERVHRMLARIAGSQEAEDLTQVVFAKAADALPGFRGDAQASTWLYRIAANVASDWLGSRSARQARLAGQDLEAADANEAATSPSIDGAPSPEHQLIRKEMNDCIRQVIGRLPDGDRTVLTLAELGGFTDGDVACTLGISRGNAKVRLHRARQKLKQALATRCDFYRDEDNEFACEPKGSAGDAPAQGSRASSAKCGRSSS
jgi:RNA polymerase sigma-70 factor (ECF subfamily)